MITKFIKFVKYYLPQQILLNKIKFSNKNMIRKLIFYRLELTSLNNYIFNNNNKLIYLKKKTQKVKFLIQ